MSERFMLRMTGGPSDGETRIADSAVMPWPLPDTLPHPNAGEYRKISESQLPAMSEDSHVLRGAEYEWHGAENSQPRGAQ